MLAWLTRNRPVEEQTLTPAVATGEDVVVTPDEPIENQMSSAPSMVPEPVVTSTPPVFHEPVETTAPIQPAPVTEEEIAALLESALSTWRSSTSADIVEEPVGDDAPEATPRRRNLPRRSEAA